MWWMRRRSNGERFYSRSSLTDRAEPAPQNEFSSIEKKVEEVGVGGSFYSRSSMTDRAELAPQNENTSKRRLWRRQEGKRTFYF